ncbi:MAG TPA: hypothetical protein VMH83_06245 [Candidatus Acidoferrum sp.]|nr:hypothetical protein [Candidatus Acidoferrum sp.]
MSGGSSGVFLGWINGNDFNISQSVASQLTAALQADSLGGNYASVTNASAVLLIAFSSENYKVRHVELRPQGGDIYVSGGSGVGASNGWLVKDGEVWSRDNYRGNVYAIAVGATTTVRYCTTYRS